MAGTARMVVNRSSLRAISSKRSRSATESGRHHGQIDKDAWQIEQTGKPAGHEDDVKGFTQSMGAV